jgi:hypothetical protein
MSTKFLVGAVLFVAAVSIATSTSTSMSTAADRQTYLRDTITFNQWCNERYDEERCAEKWSSDVGDFERSRVGLEAIETEYYDERRRRQEFMDFYTQQEVLLPRGHHN